ncbi:MAG: efflux RND transporter periplasmic adaptor subunit [Planctomycetaceae bacterium]
MQIPLTRSSLALLPCLWLPVVAGCAPAAAEPKAEPPKVTVAHPETRSLVDYDEYNGWTDASATVEVRARVRGHIDKVDFADGQFVKAGDLLFELDPRPFQSDIDRAQEQVLIAEAQQEAALKEEERQQGLFEKKAGTKSDLDRAIAQRKTWDSQISSAKEEVKRRELDLTYARVTAPISGKVSRAMLTAGNLVNAGGSDPLLTTIVAVDPIWVYFSVDERALLEYRQQNRPGSATAGEGNPLKESQVPFEFRLETEEGFPNKGTLDFADNRIDPQTGTIEVRGESPNPTGRFLPGSRVRVRVPVSSEYSAMLVPDSAILSDQDKKYVLGLNAENVVVRRDIKPGRLLDDGMRVILPGPKPEEAISADDWIIVLGLQRARINYPVQPMDANGEPTGSTKSENRSNSAKSQ